MVPVQLRDERDPDTFLIDHIVLPFEPQLGVEIHVWDRFEPGRRGFLGFGRKGRERCFIPTKILRYDVSLDEPAQSGIVYLAREVKP